MNSLTNGINPDFRSFFTIDDVYGFISGVPNNVVLKNFISKHLIKTVFVYDDMIYIKLVKNRELNIFSKFQYNKDLFAFLVTEYVQKCLDQLDWSKYQEELRKDLTKIKKLKHIENLTDRVINLIMQTVTYYKDYNGKNEIIDFDLHGIHFKNGRYDLRTSTFGPRTDEYIITEYIPIDYHESNEQDIAYIESIFKTLIREPDCLEYMKYFYGMKLSGTSINNQDLLFVYGQGASGKSTFTLLLKSILGDTYMLNLPSETFNKTTQSNQVHKILNQIKPQHRFYVAEEANSEETNAEFLKKFACGQLQTTKLYKDGVADLQMHGVLLAISNHYLNIQIDSGVSRRLITYKYKNKFTDSITEVNNETVFYRNKNLIRDLTDGQKLAVFNIIAPYCKKYYDNVYVKIPKVLLESKDENIRMNDPLIDFIDTKIIFENEAICPKDELLDEFHTMFPNRKNTTIRYLVPKLEAHNIIYDKNKFNPDKSRGCFINIRLRTAADDCKDKVPKDQLKALPVSDETYKNVIKFNKLELDLKDDIIKSKDEEIEALKRHIKMLEMVPKKSKTIKVKKVKTPEPEPVIELEHLDLDPESDCESIPYDEGSATIAFNSVFF